MDLISFLSVVALWDRIELKGHAGCVIRVFTLLHARCTRLSQKRVLRLRDILRALVSYKVTAFCLLQLDVNGIFTDGDFGEISDQPLKVGNILHKATIDVDTEGTEAAAATGSLFFTHGKSITIDFFNTPFNRIRNRNLSRQGRGCEAFWHTSLKFIWQLIAPFQVLLLAQG